MFIEVINYETGQTEPINLYDIAYFYKKENDDPSNPYVVVYKMVSGITYLEGFASSSDADAKLEDLSEAVAGGGLSQFDTYGDFPDEGNKSMVYIAKDTGQTYYWDENTSTYITTGTSGRTGVYAASVDLNSTIGASTTVNKTDLTVLVTPTVAYSEGSEVVGANSTHGLITAITSSSVTVKTIPDNTIDSFVQVANEAALPQIGQENILYYLQDTDTFRTWDATAQDYVEPDYMKELYLVSYGDTTITYNDVMTAISKNRNVFCSVRVGQGYRMVPLCFYDRTKIEFRFIRNVNHGANKTSDELHTYQLLPDNSWNTVVTNICTKIVAGTNMTSSYNSSTDTLTLNGPSNYLATDNTTEFTPTADYQPATKKYVDDNAGGEIPYFDSTDFSGSTDIGNTYTKPLDFSELKMGLNIVQVNQVKSSFYFKYNWNGTEKTGSTSGIKDLFTDRYLDWRLAIITLYVDPSDFSVYTNPYQPLGDVKFISPQNNCTQYFIYVTTSVQIISLNYPQTYVLGAEANTALNKKQDTLVSGTNIKTINNESILGSGDITIGSSAPTFNISTTSSTDKGNASTRRLDFDDLNVGTYVYYNQATASRFYYQYTKPNGSSKTTGNIINSSGSSSQIGSTDAYFNAFIVNMYHKTSDLSTMDYNKKEPLCKVTLRYSKPGYTSQTTTIAYGQEVSYLIYKSANDGTISNTPVYTHTDTRTIDYVLNNVSTKANTAYSTATTADANANSAYNLANSNSILINSLDSRVSAIEHGGGSIDETEELVATGSFSATTDSFSVSVTPESGSSMANSYWNFTGYAYNGYINSFNPKFSDSNLDGIPVKLRVDVLNPTGQDVVWSGTVLTYSNEYSPYISVPQNTLSTGWYDIKVYRLTGGELYINYGSGGMSTFDGGFHNYDNTGPLEIWGPYNGTSSPKIYLSGSTYTSQLNITLDFTDDSYGRVYNNAKLEILRPSSMGMDSGTRVALYDLGNIDASMTYQQPYTLDATLIDSLIGESINVRFLYNYDAGSSAAKSEVKLSEILLKSSYTSPYIDEDVYEINWSEMPKVLSKSGTIKNDIGDFLLSGLDNHSSSGRMWEIDMNYYCIIRSNDTFNFINHPIYMSFSTTTHKFDKNGNFLELNFNSTAWSGLEGRLERLVFQFSDDPTNSADYHTKSYEYSQISFSNS